LGRGPRNRALLHRTAARFTPPPAVLPYYVQTPVELGEAPGWYWQPHGADRPEYLGSNVYNAEATLQIRLRDQAAA
jgi:hypothetical protein